MAKQIIVTNLVSGDTFTFPSLPSKITVPHGVSEQSVDLDDLGTATRPSGRAPTDYSWTGTFWGYDRQQLPFIDPNTYRLPVDCISILETWHDAQYGFSASQQREPLQLVITDTGINKRVYMSSFEYDLDGGMGDVPYNISFREWREILVTTADPSQTQEGDVPESENADESSGDAPTIPATYTIQSGDSLVAIAQQVLGDSSRWSEIYDANRDVIGDDPNLIQPGMTLQIPGAQPTDEDASDAMASSADDIPDLPFVPRLI